MNLNLLAKTFREEFVPTFGQTTATTKIGELIKMKSRIEQEIKAETHQLPEWFGRFYAIAEHILMTYVMMSNDSSDVNKSKYADEAAALIEDSLSCIRRMEFQRQRNASVKPPVKSQ